MPTIYRCVRCQKAFASLTKLDDHYYDAHVPAEARHVHLHAVELGPHEIVEEMTGQEPDTLLSVIKSLDNHLEELLTHIREADKNWLRDEIDASRNKPRRTLSQIIGKLTTNPYK